MEEARSCLEFRQEHSADPEQIDHHQDGESGFLAVREQVPRPGQQPRGYCKVGKGYLFHVILSLITSRTVRRGSNAERPHP